MSTYLLKYYQVINDLFKYSSMMLYSYQPWRTSTQQEKVRESGFELMLKSVPY